VSRLSRWFPFNVELLAHALVAAVLFGFPAIFLAPPAIWRQPPPPIVFAASLALVYVITALIVYAMSKAGTSARIDRVALIWIVAFGAWRFGVYSLAKHHPEIVSGKVPGYVLFLCAVFALLALVIIQAFRRGAMVILVLAGIAFCGTFGWHVAYKLGYLPRPVPPTKVASIVDTSLYRLQVTKYSGWLPKAYRFGGGVQPWDSGYLIVDGEGGIFVVNEKGGGLAVRKLPYTVPVNIQEFEAGGREVFKSFKRPGVESGRFRVAGVLVVNQADKTRVLIAHHFWKNAEQCFVLRVSYLEGTHEQFANPEPTLAWQTLLDTAPCLKLNTEGPRGVRFEGLENGGRMALFGENTMLLSVGDHGFDGFNRTPPLSQDLHNSYGKILKVRLDTGEAEVYSSGHRNPQGLFVDSSGTVWADEHGPRGGDELNLIQQGVDYGWPARAYGTDYAMHSWPLSSLQGSHEGYQKPVYAFVPSVGVSSLVGVDSALFPLWKGDLLIGSLKGRTIWRTRVEQGHVTFAEPIVLKNRIRDLLMDRSGRVVAWTDEGDILFIEPAHSEASDELIAQCTGCHSLTGWDPSFIAPNLANIVGRKVAAQSDYNYSQAMLNLGGRWTRERLDAFIADPESVVPGTNMQFAGIKDPAQRKAVITYLEHLVPEAE
jgi:cytochrome c2